MTRLLSDQLTVLIPTYNRYPRLRRLLRYVRSVDLPYRVTVLDSSSDSMDLGELREGLSDSRISHVRYEPSISPVAKLADGLRRVATPYVVVWADDDFLVPAALGEGVRFLEGHRDYSVVHGQAGLFRVASNRDSAAMQWVAPYRQPSLTQETASERLRDHLRHYSVIAYSIHRTESMKKNMECCRTYGFGYTWGELAGGSLSVIQGKVKQLNDLYMLRETHPGMDSWREPSQPFDVFDWVTDPMFPITYDAFRRCLAAELARQDGISVGRAEAVVKEAFWSYVATVLTVKWQAQYGRRQSQARDRLREAAARLPALRQGGRRLQALLQRYREPLSLPALLHPSSPYHADFMPIYQMVTKEVEAGWDQERAVSEEVLTRT